MAEPYSEEYITSRIKSIIKEQNNLKEEYKNLIRNCPHKFKELSDKDIEKLKESPWTLSVTKSGADCVICGQCFGHRCPDSPDEVCHYYSHEVRRDGTTYRAVELLHGDHILPDDHESKYETDDNCIFCGYPDERL